MAEAWPTSEAEAAGGIEAGEIGVAAATAAAAAADKSQSTGWAHPPKLVCKKGEGLIDPTLLLSAGEAERVLRAFCSATI
jgi:hypothetical protein